MADFLKKETRSRLQSVAGQEIKHAKCTADGPLLRWVRRTVPEIRAGVLDLVRAVLAPRELPTSRRSVPGGAAVIPNVAGAGAFVVVLDRTTGEDVIAQLREYGGGWETGVNVWRRFRMIPYLLLVASSLERVARRAPLAVMALDASVGAAAACNELDDVRCGWIFACSDATREAVQRIALADAVPGGRA